MIGIGQDWECAEVLRAEVRRLIDTREESERQYREDWRSLRADLAAAEQRAADAEARAERLVAQLQVAERVCEAVGSWRASSTLIAAYTEPKMRDAYVTWWNYIHDRGDALTALTTQPDARAAAIKAALDRLAKRILAEIVYCAPENRSLAEEVARVAKIETDLIVTVTGDK